MFHNRRCLLLLSGLLATNLAFAQGAPSQARTPNLVVKYENRHQALNVTKVGIDTRIVGHLAETRMTLTFGNPHSRALEGELFFPLPDGATVTGYALDVAGKMVAGVAVPKAEARRIFEAEVRKGIDPGLVEFVGGNQFRTRVFPIPPNGQRTIEVKWTTELVPSDNGPAYQLPLDFKKAVPELDIRVEVVQEERAPLLVSGAKGLKFQKTRQSFIAEASMKNAMLDQPIVVAVPKRERAAVRVERGTDGQSYFAIEDVMRNSAEAAVQRFRTVRLIWDASGSRRSADHAKSIELIRAAIAQHQVKTVELVVLRNTAETIRRFNVSDGTNSLGKALLAIQYDGGTSLAAADAALRTKGVDAAYFVTDGIGNFGPRMLPDPAVPTFVMNASSGAAHSALRAIAAPSGGRYLDLSRMNVAAGVKAMERAGLRVKSVRLVSGKGAVVLPRGFDVVGPVAIAGHLESDRAEVELVYAVGDRVVATDRFVVTRDGEVEGDTLRQYWAQSKVASLMAQPGENADAIQALGMAHHIVTARTSLLVLERFEQYLEYEIRPPAMLADMRTKWDAAMEQRRAQMVKTNASKLERIVGLWQQRVKWWKKDFEYPKDFRFRKVGKKKGRSSGATAAAPRAEPVAAADDMDGEAPAEAEEEVADKKDEAKSGGDSGPSIAIKPWDPKTPYTDALKRAAKPRRVLVYMNQRAEFGDRPSFYLDCAELFIGWKDEAMAIRILSNLAEINLEDPALIRVLAHRLAQMGQLDRSIEMFEVARRFRPDEPQSHRDLALVLADRATKRARQSKAQARVDYQRALELLTQVVMERWDRFDQIELIALTELNNILPKARKVGYKGNPVDERLIQPLEMDVRIAMTWDADLTDMDLHVVEPSNEEAYYGHNRTTIGGLVSRDFTRGYGPEVYLLKKAMKGKYQIRTKYFGSSAAKLAGAVTLQVTIFTNYGRANEKRQTLTLRLTSNKEMFTVGEIEF